MMLIDLFILSLVLTTINAQNNCSRNENCTNILDCPEFRHLWKYPNEKFSEHTFQTIKRFKCSPEGNYPKVCCKQATETTEILEDTPDFPNVTNHPNLRLLDHQACGPNVNYGNKTKFFQYPWMALLRYLIYDPWDTFSKGSTEWILCSGTIISSRYILTAARCKYRSGFRVIGVRVGDYNLSKERECELDENGHEVCAERYQDIAMEKNGFYRHPDYSPFEDKNDIALIRLNDTIDFSPQNVKPICLPFGPTANIDFRRWILSGIQKVDVPGWGLTSDGSDIHSSELLSVKLHVVPNEYCKKIFSYGKKSSSQSDIWYKQLCAGGQIDVDHPCNGDAGGPLQAITSYVYDEHDYVRTVQYGVAIIGRTPCDRKLLPGIYTNVAYYMDWILNTMTD